MISLPFTHKTKNNITVETDLCIMTGVVCDAPETKPTNEIKLTNEINRFGKTVETRATVIYLKMDHGWIVSVSCAGEHRFKIGETVSLCAYEKETTEIFSPTYIYIHRTNNFGYLFAETETNLLAKHLGKPAEQICKARKGQEVTLSALTLGGIPLLAMLPTLGLIKLLFDGIPYDIYSFGIFASVYTAILVTKKLFNASGASVYGNSERLTKSFRKFALKQVKQLKKEMKAELKAA